MSMFPLTTRVFWVLFFDPHFLLDSCCPPAHNHVPHCAFFSFGRAGVAGWKCQMLEVLWFLVNYGFLSEVVVRFDVGRAAGVYV